MSWWVIANVIMVAWIVEGIMKADDEKKRARSELKVKSQNNDEEAGKKIEEENKDLRESRRRDRKSVNEVKVQEERTTMKWTQERMKKRKAVVTVIVLLLHCYINTPPINRILYSTNLNFVTRQMDKEADAQEVEMYSATLTDLLHVISTRDGMTLFGTKEKAIGFKNSKEIKQFRPKNMVKVPETDQNEEHNDYQVPQNIIHWAQAMHYEPKDGTLYGWAKHGDGDLAAVLLGALSEFMRVGLVFHPSLLNEWLDKTGTFKTIPYPDGYKRIVTKQDVDAFLLMIDLIKGDVDKGDGLVGAQKYHPNLPWNTPVIDRQIKWECQRLYLGTAGKMRAMRQALIEAAKSEWKIQEKHPYARNVLQYAILELGKKFLLVEVAVRKCVIMEKIEDKFDKNTSWKNNGLKVYGKSKDLLYFNAWNELGIGERRTTLALKWKDAGGKAEEFTYTWVLTLDVKMVNSTQQLPDTLTNSATFVHYEQMATVGSAIEMLGAEGDESEVVTAMGLCMEKLAFLNNFQLTQATTNWFIKI